MSTWILLFLILAGGLFAVKMIYLFSTAAVLPFTRGALYVSTARKKIEAFLDAVPMHSSALLIDLGCGDGRVLRQAAKRYGVRAIGYELNFLAFIRASVQCWGHRTISVRQANFFNVDLSAANIIFCYLYPDVMEDLSKKLKTELRPGTRVVSCNFNLPGLSPNRILLPGDSQIHDPIYLYRMD